MTSLLVATTLYPNQCQPRHGIFVETRLRRLLASGDHRATVVAPVPWFPFRWRRFPQWSVYRDVPAVETRHGIVVYHPRYLVLPKIGMLLTPFTLAISLMLCIARLRRQGMAFDVVDGHYYYPDGVALALIRRWLNRPLLVTARGSDINLIGQYRLPAALMRWAAGRAEASIAVSAALQQRMLGLGFPGERLHVLRNGVDARLFDRRDREAARQRLGVSGKLLVSVGNLVELKGHHIAMDALALLPDWRLLIVGDGPLREDLSQQSEQSQFAGRVTFSGPVPQDELAAVYSAADILVLASSREGMPNVLLEAMACDTPVVAAPVGGVPEIVVPPKGGRLMAQRDAAALAKAVLELDADYPAPGTTRAWALRFDWDTTISALSSLLTALSLPEPAD